MAIKTFTPPVLPTESTDKPELKLLEAEFGDGYTQAAGDGMNHIRKVVSISWECLTPAQADQVEGFLEEHGGTKPFLYRLSDSAKTLKFTCKEWSRKRGTPNALDATFRQSFLLV